MNGLYLLALALICLAWLSAASPLIMLAQLGYEHIKPLKKMAQLRAGVAFWGLLMVIYFWLVPVWNYPEAIPLILIICGFLAVAFVRFGYSLNPKLFFRLMVGLLVLITLFCFMPASRSAAGAFVGWLDEAVAERLTEPVHPLPRIPKRIQISFDSINATAFFDPVTSDPLVLYYDPEEGKIELFDGPGYHPQYKVKLEPITPDVVAQIKSRLTKEAENMLRQERARRQEVERAAKSPKIPEKIEINSVQDVVFFDPFTAEPKVWYYKGDYDKFEFFDAPGYHPQYKIKLEPITPDLVAELETELLTDTEKLLREVKKARQETQEVLKETQQVLRESKKARQESQEVLRESQE